MKIAQNEGFHSWISKFFSGGHPRAPVVGTPSGPPNPLAAPPLHSGWRACEWKGHSSENVTISVGDIVLCN